MENYQDKSIFEFNLDEESKSNLSSIAQWTNINAITGFVGIAISVLSFVIGLGKLNSSGAAAGAGFLGVLIGVGISLALNLTLFAASSNIKKALENTSQGNFETGLTKLTVYFKILGILTIIAIVIFTLALLIGIMAGGSRGI